MSKDTADGVLRCIDFWSGVPEIVTVNPVRLPACFEVGPLELLQSGYDEKTKRLTFEG